MTSSSADTVVSGGRPADCGGVVGARPATLSPLSLLVTAVMLKNLTSFERISPASLKSCEHSPRTLTMNGSLWSPWAPSFPGCIVSGGCIRFVLPHHLPEAVVIVIATIINAYRRMIGGFCPPDMFRICRVIAMTLSHDVAQAFWDCWFGGNCRAADVLMKWRFNERTTL